jgi:hypothetical protein
MGRWGASDLFSVEEDLVAVDRSFCPTRRDKAEARAFLVSEGVWKDSRRLCSGIGNHDKGVEACYWLRDIGSIVQCSRIGL